MNKLNHFDAEGNAIMVDVSDKDITERIATATGKIRVSPAVMQAVLQGSSKKGDILGVARVAGIMSTKRTADLIPMCHPLCLNKCSIDFVPDEQNLSVQAICTVKVSGKTGVEMEALTGVSTALLTIYDMCKAIDKSMEITDIRLVRKEGGKSGVYVRPFVPVVCISGVKNSGKTTFIIHLLNELVKRGIRTGVIKHDAHGFDPDVPGTDSYRIRQAGASAVSIFSDDLEMLISHEALQEEMHLQQMIHHLSKKNLDLILIEGGKFSSYPKIEIVRKAISSTPVCDPHTILAIATDLDLRANKIIQLDDYKHAADIIMALRYQE